METKEKNKFMIIPIIFLLLCCIAVVIVYQQTNTKNLSFIKLETLNENLIKKDNYKVIHSKEEFNRLSFYQEYDELNFNKYNYILVQIDTSACGEEDIIPDSYTIEGNLVSINILYTITCDRCYIMGMREPEYDYYVLPIPKRIQINDVPFYYESRNDVNCPVDMEEKPMIYIYPKEEMNIQVKLGHPELLEASYPPYQEGWNVLASPDGTLRMKDREYYGLFWEGNQHIGKVRDTGFVVKGEDTIPFLEKQLKVLGLNDKEANEFIIYWYPTLKNNPYNYIYFETKEEINNYMPLLIQPEPDSIIRIQMDYKPLTKPISVREQSLATPQRDGFTVVEWGGSLIKD